MPSIKILIADDHPLVAESLGMLLDLQEDLEVIGTVNNGWQALSFVENSQPDIIIADLQMPLLNGINMTIRLREKYPKIKVILLTMSEEATDIREGLQAGIHAYIMKSAERPELLKAIYAVSNGQKYFSEKIEKKLAEIPNPENPSGHLTLSDEVPLTPRELEIVRLVLQNKSSVEISETLFVALNTVHTHRRNLMKKIGVNTSIGLMQWAIKHGLVEP
ncbi:response regulator transcription factor [Flectobacillus roseus]|uniref:response regulator transcription factor n=1 Tax=Flectobacillus roseus TaxID=502259 RepID=UPI0024B67573|nr:response regulator transcription factor [Flectobacillus roseus]MDI9869568.1 response regulator transcription factor [Flectobacillus roseus]